MRFDWSWCPFQLDFLVGLRLILVLQKEMFLLSIEVDAEEDLLFRS